MFVHGVISEFNIKIISFIYIKKIMVFVLRINCVNIERFKVQFEFIYKIL